MSNVPDSLYTRIVDASVGKPEWKNRELGYAYRLLIVNSGPQRRAYTEKLKLTDLGWTRKVINQFYLELPFIDQHYDPDDYYDFRAGAWQGYREVELVVGGTCRVLRLAESGKPKTTLPCKDK